GFASSPVGGSLAIRHPARGRTAPRGREANPVASRTPPTPAGTAPRGPGYGTGIVSWRRIPPDARQGCGRYARTVVRGVRAGGGGGARGAGHRYRLQPR